MNTNLVGKLRKHGFVVRINHYRKDVLGNMFPRYCFGANIPMRYLSNNGGRTCVEVTTPCNKKFFGESLCSKKDYFNRKVGVNLALVNCLKQMIEFGIKFPDEFIFINI